MLKFTSVILDSIESALISSHSTPPILLAFINSLDRAEIGVDFGDTTTYATFNVQRREYIDAVAAKGSMVYFLKQYFEESPQNPEVIELKKIVENIVDLPKKHGDKAKYKKDLFECHMLLGDTLPFIDRDELKAYLYDLVHGKNRKYFFITGEQKTGLSYTLHYLGRISELTGHFKVVKVNFNDIFREVQGQIQMVHIALEIAKMTGMVISYDLTVKEHFKSGGEYLRDLYNFLNKSDETFLFFFDQFNISCSTEVEDFIAELVRNLHISGTRVNNYYVVLVGYRPDKLKEWDERESDLVFSAGRIKVEPFTQDHLTEFLKKMYLILSDSHQLSFSEEDFINLLKQEKPFFAQDLFVQNGKSNVVEIGRGVRDWLNKFKKQIAS